MGLTDYISGITRREFVQSLGIAIVTPFGSSQTNSPLAMRHASATYQVPTLATADLNHNSLPANESQFYRRYVFRGKIDYIPLEFKANVEIAINSSRYECKLDVVAGDKSYYTAASNGNVNDKRLLPVSVYDHKNFPFPLSVINRETELSFSYDKGTRVDLQKKKGAFGIPVDEPPKTISYPDRVYMDYFTALVQAFLDFRNGNQPKVVEFLDDFAESKIGRVEVGSEGTKLIFDLTGQDFKFTRAIITFEDLEPNKVIIEGITPRFIDIKGRFSLEEVIKNP